MRSDEDLIEDVRQKKKAGDFRAAHASFAALWRNWYLSVLAFLMRLLFNEEDAKDATAKTFAKAWENADRFRLEKGRFRSWLFGIARHIGLDRKKKREPLSATSVGEVRENDGGSVVDVIPDRQPTAQEKAIAQENAESVRRCVSKLPEPHRTVIVLRYWQQLTNEEIAAILGTLAGNVGRWLFEARRKLAECLKEEIDLDP